VFTLVCLVYSHSFVTDSFPFSRGKKVFRRFDDGSEEEETTIDPDDLGLLEHTTNGAEAVKLLKPLTRKSIQPIRLFQTEEQKRLREAEKAEEETVTDIEEEPDIEVGEASRYTLKLSTSDRQTRSATATKLAQTPEGNGLDKTEDSKAVIDVDEESPSFGKLRKGKRSSPFDSWKRLKSAPSTSPASPTKGRKRTSSALEEGNGEQSSISKKLRSR
jgi:hypothetical protein